MINNFSYIYENRIRTHTLLDLEIKHSKEIIERMKQLLERINKK